MKSYTGSGTLVAPTQAIMSPTDNKKILNFINFNNLGSSNLNTSTAFKKIQSASKFNPSELFTYPSDYSSVYTKLSNLYLSDFTTHSNSNLKISRKVLNTSKFSSHIDLAFNLDKNNVDRVLSKLSNFKLNTNDALTSTSTVNNIINFKSNEASLNKLRPVLLSSNVDLNTFNIRKNFKNSILNLTTLPTSHYPTTNLSKKLITVSYDKFNK